jgi:hypothetical protein
MCFFGKYNRINMDISNSSDDDDTMVINKKTSFKVSYFSSFHIRLIFLFWKPETDEELSVAGEEEEDVEEMSAIWVQRSVKKKINNKQVIRIKRRVWIVIKSFFVSETDSIENHEYSCQTTKENCTYKTKWKVLECKWRDL